MPSSIHTRINYIDALRGFAILSVVYSHMIVMGLRDSGYCSPITPIIQLYFMPLFFFISGLFGEKISENLTSIKDLGKIIWKKMQILFIPTIIMFIFCTVYFHQSFQNSLVDSFKNGYWFTYVLFCIISLHAFLEFILKTLDISEHMGGVILTVIALCMGYVSRHINVFSPIIKLLSADFILAFFFYYIAGVLAARYKIWFYTILDNNGASLIILAGSILPCFIQAPYYITNPCRLLQAIVLFKIFRYYRRFFEKNTIIAKGLCIIGRNTMEIYFLQYFLLFRLDFASKFLVQLSSDYCFRGHSCNALLELIIVGTASIIISYVCILIKKIVKPFPLLSKLCFGK